MVEGVVDGGQDFSFTSAQLGIIVLGISIQTNTFSSSLLDLQQKYPTSSARRHAPAPDTNPLNLPLRRTSKTSVEDCDPALPRWSLVCILSPGRQGAEDAWFIGVDAVAMSNDLFRQMARLARRLTRFSKVRCSFHATYAMYAEKEATPRLRSERLFNANALRSCYAMQLESPDTPKLRAEMQDEPKLRSRNRKHRSTPSSCSPLSCR